MVVSPTGHGEQATAAVEFAKVPCSHHAHSEVPQAAAKNPARHGSQCSAPRSGAVVASEIRRGEAGLAESCGSLS
eukprot:CAMPEP_0177427772 /NCGR_PEP_ID=MMETSP0368-20130122/74227_1 /TAXON_ID=447022 ORGANISM="Scrippsiella hangoei-like, Strain SHHI-4" /NCGR_SAMPLE_ID=MMETSP0368 /ASSEMBLY_ACC=CAM_ASM_000363 /LENGTH=74 /DNA_ID=CAMNT_0018898173 /DNA_START=412 /DNA_END=633 /DNA_ORIENTATION=-